MSEYLEPKCPEKGLADANFFIQLLERFRGVPFWGGKCALPVHGTAEDNTLPKETKCQLAYPASGVTPKGIGGEGEGDTTDLDEGEGVDWGNRLRIQLAWTGWLQTQTWGRMEKRFGPQCPDEEMPSCVYWGNVMLCL